MASVAATNVSPNLPPETSELRAEKGAARLFPAISRHCPGHSPVWECRRLRYRESTEEPRECQNLQPEVGSSGSQLWSQWRGKVGGDECLFYRRDRQWEEVGRQTPAQRPNFFHWPLRGQELLQREGATGRNSTVSSDNNLEIGHIVVWPASFWLSTLNLQSQDQFVPISLKPAFRIVAAYIVRTVRSSCGYLVIPGGLFYKTAHRIWLWILTIACEEELKVLDCV